MYPFPFNSFCYKLWNILKKDKQPGLRDSLVVAASFVVFYVCNLNPTSPFIQYLPIKKIKTKFLPIPIHLLVICHSIWSLSFVNSET